MDANCLGTKVLSQEMETLFIAPQVKEILITHVSIWMVGWEQIGGYHVSLHPSLLNEQVQSASGKSNFLSDSNPETSCSWISYGASWKTSGDLWAAALPGKRKSGIKVTSINGSTFWNAHRPMVLKLPCTFLELEACISSSVWLLWPSKSLYESKPQIPVLK